MNKDEYNGASTIDDFMMEKEINAKKTSVTDSANLSPNLTDQLIV